MNELNLSEAAGNKIREVRRDGDYEWFWGLSWGLISGGGNGNPLQYSCLENPTDREAWRVSLWGLKESDTT